MTINILAKDGSNQIIFVDKICNISQTQSGSTIGLVNGTNIVVNYSPSEILNLMKPKS